MKNQGDYGYEQGLQHAHNQLAPLVEVLLDAAAALSRSKRVTDIMLVTSIFRIIRAADYDEKAMAEHARTERERIKAEKKAGLFRDRR